jgi:predicted N-formylglutamate amidohydrolase
MGERVTRRDRSFQIVVSCEHGGNLVPEEYAEVFVPYADVLKTHRGHDIGSLDLAKDIASAVQAPLYFSTTTRLLIDLNRSMRHPSLFSEATRGLSTDVRQRILDVHYRPYRRDVESAIADLARSSRVLHLSIHTFTPVLNGEVRKADVGLLYDPRRRFEREFCDAWAAAIEVSDPSLIVRRNYPYRGVADGFVTYLRRQFSEHRYVGVELELNQTFPIAGGSRWRNIRGDLAMALTAAIEHGGRKR